MAHQLTNEKINVLLVNLGFETREIVNSVYRQWQHPQSGCTLILPANKTQEAPRHADLVGIQAQLDLQGHLEAEAFDLFVSEGRLPATIQH